MFRKNFNLIELTVIFAVLSILLSIFLPALTHARREALMAVCKNNSRQLLLANILYCSDNDNLLPDSSWGNKSNSVSWIYRNDLRFADDAVKSGSFYSYLNEVAPFKCPAHTNVSADPQLQNMTSYHMNPVTHHFSSQNIIFRQTDFEEGLIILWEPETGVLIGDASGLPRETEGTYAGFRSHSGRTVAASIDGSTATLKSTDFKRLANTVSKLTTCPLHLRH